MAIYENYKIMARHVTAETFNAFIELIETDERLTDRKYEILRIIAIDAVYAN